MPARRDAADAARARAHPRDRCGGRAARARGGGRVRGGGPGRGGRPDADLCAPSRAAGALQDPPARGRPGAFRGRGGGGGDRGRRLPRVRRARPDPRRVRAAARGGRRGGRPRPGRADPARGDRQQCGGGVAPACGRRGGRAARRAGGGAHPHPAGPRRRAPARAARARRRVARRHVDDPRRGADGPPAPRRDRGPARATRGPGARHRAARRRRRLRHQGHVLPRVHRGGRAGPTPRPADQVGRDAARAHPGRLRGARPGVRRGDRGHPRGCAARPQGRLPPRDGRLHHLRPQPAPERDDPLGGLLRDPGPRPALPRRDDDHDSGGCLPRRRPPVWHRGDRAGHGRARARAPDGPGRAAPPQPGAGRPASLRDRAHHRRARARRLRQRRLPALHGPGARGPGPARGPARAGAAARAGSLPRHRPRQLRGGHRHRPERERGGAGARRRPGHRGERGRAARAGPRDHVLAPGRPAARRRRPTRSRC